MGCHDLPDCFYANMCGRDSRVSMDILVSIRIMDVSHLISKRLPNNVTIYSYIATVATYQLLFNMKNDTRPYAYKITYNIAS